MTLELEKPTTTEQWNGKYFRVIIYPGGSMAVMQLPLTAVWNIPGWGEKQFDLDELKTEINQVLELIEHHLKKVDTEET